MRPSPRSMHVDRQLESEWMTTYAASYAWERHVSGATADPPGGSRTSILALAPENCAAATSAKFSGPAQDPITSEAGLSSPRCHNVSRQALSPTSTTSSAPTAKPASVANDEAVLADRQDAPLQRVLSHASESPVFLAKYSRFPHRPYAARRPARFEIPLLPRPACPVACRRWHTPLARGSSRPDHRLGEQASLNAS